MYDVNQNKSFLIGANPDQSLPLWWDDAEPVWVTAEKRASLFNILPTTLAYSPPKASPINIVIHCAFHLNLKLILKNLNVKVKI